MNRSQACAALDQLPVVVWTTDRDLRFTSIAGSEAHDLGLDPERAVGRSLEECLGGAGSEQSARAAAGQALAGLRAQCEIRRGARLYEAVMRPLRTSDDIVIGTAAALLDVTEQRRLEIPIHTDRRMEAIERLAYGVAHDLNNTLSVIESYAALLRERVTSEQGRSDLAIIRRAAKRGGRVIAHLLAFSRRQVLHACLLDLGDVVSDLERDLRGALGDSISLELELAPGLGQVEADREKLEQVILSLAQNACEAMPAGGAVHVRTRNIELDRGAAARLPGLEPGSYVVLSIRDTGPGIPREIRERIFEPFFTTKEAPVRGAGLGLSTAYGIIKQSGGSILVESEPDRGATFEIYLPRSVRPDAGRHSLPNPLSPDARTR